LQPTDRLAVLALGDLREGELEHQLRLGRIEREGVTECRFRRSEATSAEVAVGQDRAEQRVGWLAFDRALRKADGLGVISRIQRRERPAAEPDV